MQDSPGPKGPLSHQKDNWSSTFKALIHIYRKEIIWPFLKNGKIKITHNYETGAWQTVLLIIS